MFCNQILGHVVRDLEMKSQENSFSVSFVNTTVLCIVLSGQTLE